MWTIAGPTNLAGYKSISWTFQQEVRYIIMIIPTPPLPYRDLQIQIGLNSVPKFVFESIRSGTGPDINYLDINIAQHFLDNINIMLGPSSSESDKIIVKTLLKEYTKNGLLTESKLTNSIRPTEI